MSKSIIGKICNILAYIAFYVLVYLLVLVTGTILSDMFPFIKGWTGACAMLAGAGCLFLFLSDRNELLKKPEKTFPVFVCVMFLAAGICVGLNWLMGMIPWEKIQGTYVVQNDEALFSIPFYLRLIAYVVVAPLAEELLFRGIIFRKAKEFMPLWVAMVVSAVAFGLYHGNLQQGLYAFLCGCALAWVYAVTDSFAVSVLFHATANLIVNLAYEFEMVQKIVYSVPSLCVLVVLAVISAILLSRYGKNRKNREK